ncbi:MAG: hypothetical protein ABIN18_22425 [Pseudomonadota bacterium]
MQIEVSGKAIKRKGDETLDDFILRVLRMIDSPVCMNTLSVFTGLPPSRVCKILSRLEDVRRVKRVTNVFHSYWKPA